MDSTRFQAMNLVLDIPLLRDKITFSLTPHDFTVCALVNTTWNSAFSPLIWKNLSLIHQRIVSQFQQSTHIQQGLLRNSDYIHSIHSFFCYAFQSLPENTPFRNLVHLDSLASELQNNGIVDHVNTRRLLQFVNVNTSLRQITLTNFPLESVPTSKLLGETLAQHPELTSISISCFREADLSSIQHILRGAALCPRLEKLVLVCRSNVVSAESPDQAPKECFDSNLDPDPYSLFAELEMQDLPVSRLKDLTLDANLEDAAHITLLPLVQHCPHLERLFVPCMNIAKSLKDLCQILRSSCPRLQHLETGYHPGSDEHQAMLLDSCQDLRSFTMKDGLPLGDLSMDTLLSHEHSLTLDKLDIKSCTAIESKHLQLILTSCPNLTTFEALSSTHRPDGFDPRLDIKDMFVSSFPSSRQPAWVCRNLKVLHIGFTGFSAMPESQSVQPYVDHIYNQLGALTQLRVLYLGGEISPSPSSFPANSRAWAFDLTLASGIGKLESLRELEVLSVQRLRHHRIGGDEARWMATHWPKLRTLYGPPQLVELVSSISSSSSSVLPITVGYVGGGGGGRGGGARGGSCKSKGYATELMRHQPTLTVSLAV
ncbi:hypothetical protein BGZ51_003641 [Haplosporangium sp. Z 767]|nr:hypothetical protein BGZ51_003641 [Haplosporangium sp. Z 767]KAF9188587.1 hypothetical protein BGZ50_001240 [Haplosporangium sp. Z 11]